MEVTKAREQGGAHGGGVRIKGTSGRQGKQKSLHVGDVRQSLHFLISGPRDPHGGFRDWPDLSHWDVTLILRPAKGTRDFPGQSVHPSQETALFIPATIPELYFHTVNKLHPQALTPGTGPTVSSPEVLVM